MQPSQHKQSSSSTGENSEGQPWKAGGWTGAHGPTNETHSLGNKYRTSSGRRFLSNDGYDEKTRLESNFCSYQSVVYQDRPSGKASETDMQGMLSGEEE